MAASYADKLKDPRWQKKRLEIMERDGWKCQRCFDHREPLVVHHKYYISGRDPWDYPDECYVTLCEFHHKLFHKEFRKTLDNRNDLQYLQAQVMDINETDIFLLYSWIDNITFHEGKDGFKKIMDAVYPLTEKDIDIFYKDLED